METNKNSASHYGSYIHRIAHRTKMIVDSELGDINLTHEQGKLISFIGKLEGHQDVFQYELESALHLRRSSISSLLNNLEKKELLLRSCVASDARVKKIQLTDQGRTFFRECKEVIDRIETRIVAGMTLEQQTEFKQLLKLALENLEE